VLKIKFIPVRRGHVWCQNERVCYVESMFSHSVVAVVVVVVVVVVVTTTISESLTAEREQVGKIHIVNFS
jgi:hypothetical protein